MSRTGNFYDNAPMESFFHILKVELVHQGRWTTQAEARRALFEYIATTTDTACTRPLCIEHSSKPGSA